jgi:ascorbate-specific PTS system EIIC-type component UlaA
MVEKSVIVGSAIGLVLLVAGAFLVLNSLAPLEKKNVLLADTFSVGPESYQNRTVTITSEGLYVSSFEVTGGTINFSYVPSVELWLEGYEPSWFETDQTDAAISVGIEQGMTSHLNMVFLNNDTSTKSVDLEVYKKWTETNYAGLLGGATLAIAGAIIAIVLMYRHKTLVPMVES